MKLLTGLLSVVSVYAIVMTLGRTVLLLCPVLIVVLGFFIKKVPETTQVPSVSQKRFVAPLLIMSIIAVAAFIPSFISFSKGDIKFLGDDQNFYVTLASYLNATGLENNVPDFFGANYFTVAPYHYGDIWFFALLSKLSGVNTATLLALVGYPVLATVTACGVAATAEAIYPTLVIKWWKAALLPILVIVASGFTFLYPSFIVDWNRYDNSFYNVPKYLTPTILVIGLFLTYRRNQLIAFSAMAALASCFFLSLGVPVILGASVIVILRYFRKRISFRQLVVCGILLVSGLAYPFLFYKLLTKPFTDLVYHSSLALFTKADVKRAVFGQAFSSVIQLCCYVVQGVFIYCLYRRLQTTAVDKVKPGGRNILIFVLCFLLAGQLAMTVMYNFGDNWQLYAQLLLPIMNIAIATVLLIGLSNKAGRPLQAASLVLLAINFAHSYITDDPYRSHSRHVASQASYNQVAGFIREEAPRFAELTNTSVRQNLYKANTQLFKRLFFLSYRYDPYINVSINTPLVPLDSSSARELFIRQQTVNIAPFSPYYAQQRAAGMQLEDIQLQYVQANRINYLLVPQSLSVPQQLLRHADDSLFIPDEQLRIFHLSFRP